MGALLDAQALVALFRDEPGASDVETVLRRGSVAMTAPNLAETLDVLARVDRYADELLKALVEPLGIGVIPMTEQHAWRAAQLRTRHYRRADSAVSLADCCLAATATPADVIVTADRSVLRMAEAEGIATIALPEAGRNS